MPKQPLAGDPLSGKNFSCRSPRRSRSTRKVQGSGESGRRVDQRFDQRERDDQNGHSVDMDMGEWIMDKGLQAFMAKHTCLARISI